MINPELARAQAETLSTWADQWEREAAISTDEYKSVPLLLRHAARLMTNQPDEGPGAAIPDPPNLEVRAG